MYPRIPLHTSLTPTPFPLTRFLAPLVLRASHYPFISKSSQLMQSSSPNPQDSAPQLPFESTPPSPPRLPCISLPSLDENAQGDSGLSITLEPSIASHSLESAWQHHEKSLEQRR